MMAYQPKQWMKWLVLAAGIYNLLWGHGIGWAQGNSFQMPGVFIYYQGRVIDGFLHDQASDRPDYVGLANQATQPSSVAAAS